LIAINHLLPQVEGLQFPLWTDHKPLVAAMTRVTLPALGRQQRHLTFIAEHTPGVDNMVADAPLRPPTPPPPPPANHFVQECHVVAAAVTDSELLLLDLKEMALKQILCQQVQQLLHSPKLMIGFKQVGDFILWGDVSTCTFCPLCPCLTSARYLTNPGLRATRPIIFSRYVLRGHARDITAWAWEFLHCQSGKVHHHMRLRPVHVTVPEYRLSHIHVDLIGLLPA
jgi:hypothetical protein